MPLTDREVRLCRAIEKRREFLLEDLRLHVGLPTGGNNRAALDETRGRLVARLEQLGARTTLVPGDPKPDWLYGVPADGYAPPTAVCTRVPKAVARPLAPLQAGCVISWRREDGARVAEGEVVAEIESDVISMEVRAPVAGVLRLASRSAAEGGSLGHIEPSAGNADVSDGNARILLAGHMDTVHDPAGRFRELSIAPDSRTATGPGCVDMKGGLVIMVAALEALEESGIASRWTVLLNSDEETGSYHSERAIRAESRRHDVGLAVEPAMADGGLAVERLGTGHFRIDTRGRSAHVGRDFDRGVSAVTALAECLVRVGRMSDAGRGKIANVGPIEGGNATNVVPDAARAWGNVRFPDKQTADELKRELESLGTPGDELPGATVRTSFIRAAKPLTPGTQRLAEAARAAAEDLGQKLPFGKTGGVCDGNIMQDEGLPTIDTLGVRGGGLHTPQEWIELASLVERCQMLAVLVARLADAKS